MFGRNGFKPQPHPAMASNDGLTEMQRDELGKIAASPASDEAKEYAVFNLMAFSDDVMTGKVRLG